MKKPVLLFTSPESAPELGALTKAHVSAYTRKDGAFVAEHDDKRVAKPKAGGGDQYGHPNVVGHAEKLQGGDAKEAHGFHFAGKEFTHTGKEGKSAHDGTPVRHFAELTGSGDDDGEHVWMDHSGRVHADDTSSVKRLRGEYEAHKAKSGAKPAAAKPKAGGGDAHVPISKPEHTDFHRWRFERNKNDAALKEHEDAAKTVNGGSAVEHHDRSKWHDAMASHYDGKGDAVGADLHNKAAEAHRGAFGSFQGFSAKKHTDVDGMMDKASTADNLTREAVKHDIKQGHY